MSEKETIGLDHGTVRLFPFSSEWKTLYDIEAAELRRILNDLVLDIEHIGSTAMPNMPAKPIIDIAASVGNEDALKDATDLLEAQGYDYKGEYGLPGRHFFIKGVPNTHHLHFVVQGSHHWKSWILFRDFLTAHSDVAEAYSHLKYSLADKYANNRPEYTRAKGVFIEKTLVDAGL